jgi:hypothetical protein
MYNNFKLFGWNNPNIHLTNKDHMYNNIILHTGSVIQGQWENTVCFTQINNELKIIPGSNHFVGGPNWGVGYNSKYKIFDNIVNNYHEILNKPCRTTCAIKFESVYIGAGKITLQIKLHEAEIKLAGTTIKRLRKPVEQKKISQEDLNESMSI